MPIKDLRLDELMVTHSAWGVPSTGMSTWRSGYTAPAAAAAAAAAPTAAALGTVACAGTCAGVAVGRGESAQHLRVAFMLVS